MEGTGKQYWRSLDQLAGTPEFRHWLEREFPEGATELLESQSRRALLKLMAASLGLAGLTACRRPAERIVPASRAAEGAIPGEPLHYATAMELGGASYGVLVTVYDGRPVKIEGNPQHPASAGATLTFAQAAILTLYDPDRSRSVLRQGRSSSWAEFEAFAREHFTQTNQGRGERLWFLSGYRTSPTRIALELAIRERFPNSRWVFHEAIDREQVYRGSETAFGERLEAHYRFRSAKVIVALDADFLGVEALEPAAIREFADGRVPDASGQMSRLYAIESRLSATGAVADHRLAMRSADIPAFAVALARALGLPVPARWSERLDPTVRKWAEVIARDLARHRGQSLVLAGWAQAAPVHALVHWINEALGNHGQTVEFTASPVRRDELSLEDLREAAAAGAVETLVILGNNPLFTGPGNVHVAEWLPKIPTTIHVGVEVDETARACRWHLPEAHWLESWGDVRARNGLASIQQPVLEPLFGGRSVLEVLSLLAGYGLRRPYEQLRQFWDKQWPEAERQARWHRALYEGWIAGTDWAPRAPRVDTQKVLAGLEQLVPGEPGLEVRFYPSPSVYDGRFANNGWLQELPDPITKITWDNAVLIAPQLARRLQLKSGDVLRIEHGGRAIEAPVWISPGQAAESLAVEVGYGRRVCGRVGRHVGHDAYPLRHGMAWFFAGDLKIAKTGKRWTFACTQDHHAMEGRELVREATLEEFLKRPDFAQHTLHHAPAPPLHEEPNYDDPYQWGMVIDLNRCVGCNACVVACQAENNIPIVGKRQVARGREMHWIRIDRYYAGDLEDPEVVFQPVTCHHCEQAPCETVCPVAATVHSADGLNVMVYNRCVGTRYCSNNCPYKVRRFNFLNWHKELSEIQKLAFNPEVTVRMRGVMEKCTYCVQRIERARIRAKAEGRRALKDEEIVTACQQACPAGAIVFGNIRDPRSRVANLKALPRNYAMLAELNVRPRTSYLARVRNPNPELEGSHG